MHYLRLLLVLFALFATTLSAAEWAGTWSNDQFTLVLNGETTAITGEAVVAGKSYPVTAVERSGALSGAFTAENAKHAFQAELRGELMLLTLDDGRFELRKHVKPAGPLTGGGALPVDPLVGTWRTDAGEVADLRADGSAMVAGAPARWQAVGASLVFANAQGDVILPYRLEGDRLSVEVNGQQIAYRRIGAGQPVAAHPAATPDMPPSEGPLTVAGLIGVWIGPEGSSELRAGGVGKTKGKEFAWVVQDALLIFTKDGESLQVPARLSSGRLILGSGPTVTMERATGAAGWWSGWDGHVDPTMAMSIIHRIALYPDGTVGYVKGEMDATRRQDWFSYRADQTDRQTVGRWQQQGADIQFTLGTGSYRAVFDPAAQTMRVIGLGQINEGQDVAFERE